MSPILKKAVVAIGAKKALDVINEKRNPKPSKKSGLGKLLLIAGGLGGIFYAYNSGKLQPLLDKVRGDKGRRTGATSNGSGTGRDVTLGSQDRTLSSPVT